MKNSSSKKKSPIKLKINSKKFFFYFCRLFPAAVMITLFVLPMGMESLNLSNEESVSKLIYPYLLPFTPGKSIQESPLHYVYFLIYFVPFTALFLLISLFIKDKVTKVLYVVTYISFSIFLFCSVRNSACKSLHSIWIFFYFACTYVNFRNSFYSRNESGICRIQTNAE